MHEEGGGGAYSTNNSKSERLEIKEIFFEFTQMLRIM